MQETRRDSTTDREHLPPSACIHGTAVYAIPAPARVYTGTRMRTRTAPRTPRHAQVPRRTRASIFNHESGLERLQMHVECGCAQVEMSD